MKVKVNRENQNGGLLCGFARLGWVCHSPFRAGPMVGEVLFHEGIWNPNFGQLYLKSPNFHS